MRRSLLVALAVAALVPATAALGGAQAPAASASALLPAALAEGATLYAFNCSVCHGPTGGGLAEARLAFPPGERHCTRCHKPNNPVVMPLTQSIIDNDMFSIGTPPALHELAGEGAGPPAMAAVTPPEALFVYLRATMPRYHPGRQSDSEYWLLTAYLLDMNGRDAAAEAAAEAAVGAGWEAPAR